MMLFLVASMFVVLGTFQANLIKGDHSSEFTNSAVLDEAATVKLYWSVDWDSKTVTFAVEALTTGWVGFGISEGRGQMIGADIVIGGVTDDGKHYFMDCHANNYSEPTVDEKQDYDLLSLTETGNITTMKFKRQFDTCDGQDNKIEEGTSKVIYAYHPSDPRSPDYFPKHITKGSRSLMLLNTGKSKPILPANLTFLDILNNQTKVSADETTYWCKVFEIPRMERGHHVVKVEPVVQKGHEGLVHHILLYECPDSFPTSFLNHSGYCYNETTPREIMECAGQSIVAAWAIGGGSFYYPEHVGLRIGTDDTPRYIVMETHYDNPDHRDDFVDSSGLRLWYTNETRKYDASTLFAGWDVTYQMVIPPKQSKWETVGYCPGACTEKGLENAPLEGHKGVKLFAALLHTHLAGRQVRVKHIRYGTELKEIVFDNHYDFNFQEYQMLTEEIELWPRDELMVSCTYNTETLKDVTFGGFRTKDEMCLVFLMYYPQANLKKCSSKDQVAFASVYLKHFWKGGANFLNITPETWSDEVTEDLRQAYKNENTKINVNCQGYNNKQVLDGGSHSKPKIVYRFQPDNGPCVRKIHNEFEFEPEQNGCNVSSNIMMALPAALVTALYRML